MTNFCDEGSAIFGEFLVAALPPLPFPAIISWFKFKIVDQQWALDPRQKYWNMLFQLKYYRGDTD